MQRDQLRRYLQRTTARRVSLILDDDKREIVRTTPLREGWIGLRLHGSFLDASGMILKALVRFLRQPEPRLRRRVEALYRRAGLHRVGGGGGTRRIVLRHEGEFFDLKQIYDELNEKYFGGQLQAFVTWGRRTSAQRRSRSIHFGSYNWARRVIRIHPDLDREYVPQYFIESILYHEMLHARLGITEGRGGRRSSHTAEFRRLEREGPWHQKARDWERAHLHYFLRAEPLSPARSAAPRAPARRRAPDRQAARRAKN
jgi:hypothetical protein